MVLIVGVLMSMWSSITDRQSNLSSQLSVHNVAGLLLATKQYPPILLKTTVRPQDWGKLESAARDGIAPIHEFIITDLRLQHRSSSLEHSVALGSNHFSSNTSSTRQTSVDSV